MKNTGATQEYIRIRGARVHNLKNVDVDIPRNKFVVITGLSGSGKTSLAFDTIYAEGERRFVESLSSYARQFLGVKDKPDVDSIDGLSPAISIDQKSISRNPRSTVGTITEVYDYLRLLYSRVGRPHCPQCGNAVVKQSVSQVVGRVLEFPEKSEIAILAPLVRDKKGEHKGILKRVEEGRYVRVRFDGTIMRVEEAMALETDPKKKHSVEVVIDRLKIEPDIDKARVADSLEQAFKLGDGAIIVQVTDANNAKTSADSAEEDKAVSEADVAMPTPENAQSGDKKSSAQTKIRKQPQAADHIFSERFACASCGISLPEIEPRLFSFNNPHGACPQCTGLGVKLEVDPDLVLPNPRLTIAEGAIRPWAGASHRVGRQGWYMYMLSELARRHKFSLDVPVKNLPKNVIELVLYGEKNRESGKAFEGVIPNLERRYRESESDYTKAEIEQYMVEKICEVCSGKRLKPEALAVKFIGKGIDELVRMTTADAMAFFGTVLTPPASVQASKHDEAHLTKSEMAIITPLLKEVMKRLQFLVDVGLEYLTIDRSAKTLAGGEGQRIRLATQIGSQLVGVLYILDEPSIGLHPRDHDRLIASLKRLRDLGNSVIVVEHDRETIMQADFVVDVGPAAGRHGGEIVAKGTPAVIKKAHTLTGDYLSGRKEIEIPKTHRKGNGKNLVLEGATQHNLKNVTAKFPLGTLTVVTGVSGSGKSTLVIDTLARILAQKFYQCKAQPGAYKDIKGLEHIDKVVHVDQSPIGRTPRSNPATYIGAFAYIRDLLARTEEARVRGYGPGRFSFNVKGGRCETCRGEGVRKIEMYFLPDMYVECEECRGKRYNREALEILYKEKNIADVLDMNVDEALKFFEHIPGLRQKLKTLSEVGLGYVKVGQPATTLSGGEAQRVKLANELARRDTGRTLYILDEPTTGLHFDDIKKLLHVLQRLVDKGNTVIVIEHNLDVVKCADWVIDMGPEGGSGGGYIVAEGKPADIMKAKKSYTGQWLKTIV